MFKLLKVLKWILIVILTLVVGLVVLNVVPFTFSSVEGTNNFRKTGKYPLVIPHGGAKDLAPENTIYSYEMLVNDLEVDVLEIDLALTKDNILMSHHDLDLEMSENSLLNDKLIKDYTYQEILDEYLADDYHLARKFTLPSDLGGNKPFETETDPAIMSKMVPANLEEDIFKVVGNSVLYILEIKDSPTSIGYEEGSDRFELAASKLIELVQEYELSKYVVLASFSDDVTAYFKEKAPDIMINAAVGEVTNFSIYSAFYIDFFWGVKSEVLILPNPSSMSIPAGTAKLLGYLPGFIRDSIAVEINGVYRANLMHKQIINDAHRKNMAVLYWTINDPEEMKLLIANGADGIITDRPDLLIDIINQLENGS